jgi:RimJ/RimL family protein N-acetyltransferase
VDAHVSASRGQPEDEPRVHLLSDGLVTIRPPDPGDAGLLIAGRDPESRRWLGEGFADPCPAACIEVGGQIVGWIDYDCARDWLAPGEINIGYNVFPAGRNHGYATRALQLLMDHLAFRTGHRTAALLIDPRNTASLAVAAKAGFQQVATINDQRLFKRAIRRHSISGQSSAPTPGTERSTA